MGDGRKPSILEQLHKYDISTNPRIYQDHAYTVKVKYMTGEETGFLPVNRINWILVTEYELDSITELCWKQLYYHKEVKKLQKLKEAIS